MHITPKEVMNLLKWFFGKSKRLNKPAYCIEKTVRVLCMGKQGVGKTSVIQKLCGNEEFEENNLATIYDDHLKQIIVDECNVSFQFMDLGGSQSFPSMQQVFISQADIYLLFYAVDDVESFHQMLEYRDKITSHKGKHSTELPLLIIRNKVDLKQRRLRKEVERRKTINQWCGKVYDVSAKTGIKINAIMDSLIEESKFIGNNIDRENMKISGRYLYQENNGKTEFSASEVYHKAPTLFGEKDNSDEKMEKRRRRSLQQQSRKMSMRKAGDSLKRHHSFASFRRKSKDAGIPLWMRLEKEKEKDGAEESNGDVQPTPIENKRSFEETSFEKTVSKETIESYSPKDSNNTSVQLNTSERRNIFRLSRKKSSVIESPHSSPANINLMLRRKSLSQPDLTWMQAHLNDRSMTSPTFKRKISFRNKSKPKPEIVHTTLKNEENDEIIPFTGQPRYRKPSTASRSSRSSRSSAFGRKQAISIDDVSEDESESTPPPSRLDRRRRSLSQNDLSLSVQSFNNKTLNERTHGALVKKQKNSLPARITDQDTTSTSINKNWTRSASFNRKKTSLQAYQAFREHIVEVDEEIESEKLLRRKNSSSMTNVISVAEEGLLKHKARPRSFDENKNCMVNTPKSTSRPSLHKGISFDFETLGNLSPTSKKWLHG